MRGTAALDGSASDAAVSYDISSPRVRYRRDRLHLPAAGAGAVAGVFVHMERPEAERAVIARGVAERLDLPAAMRAHKAGIVF